MFLSFCFSSMSFPPRFPPELFFLAFCWCGVAPSLTNQSKSLVKGLYLEVRMEKTLVRSSLIRMKIGEPVGAGLTWRQSGNPLSKLPREVELVMMPVPPPGCPLPSITGRSGIDCKGQDSLLIRFGVPRGRDVRKG